MMLLTPAAASASLGAVRHALHERKVASAPAGRVRLDYDLRDGTAALSWDGAPRLRGFSSAVRLGGRLISSRDYSHRRLVTKGAQTTVSLTGGDLPPMVQRFTLDPRGYALVRVEVTGKGLRSNWMAPIICGSAGCVDLGAAKDPRALQAPFDNDKWTRYKADPIDGDGSSYEVSAFYDNASRRGLVVGSVTHDTWKTGIRFKGDGGRLTALTVFGGIADIETRDVLPHGSVTGKRLSSPTVFVGYSEDWRNGLEAYANANAAQAPPLRWTGGVPFGWNSWGRVKKAISYAKAVAASDFFAGPMRDAGFMSGGTAYINLDSYWDNLTDAELRRFAGHAHANGQKAGIYWAPFVYWGQSMAAKVEGSTASYGEILLRAPDGKPISLDGAYAVDPTHPAALARIDHFIDRFEAAGFDFLKLDFLTHGSLEGGSRNGEHYNRAICTGIQAFNLGMRHLARRVAGTMFLSESIAPLFPYQYAHARRVSCDSFGGIGETEYVMNCESYGWWASGRLYAFNDPDHMVLEGHSPAENRSRITSGVTAGTLFLSGDDVTEPEGRRLVETYLTNAAVNAVARLGVPFRPMEGNTGRAAAEVMVMSRNGASYIAAFNYSSDAPVSRRVDLARAGLDPGASYAATDLWTGRAWIARGEMLLDLGPADCALVKLVRAPGR
jgi:hypothetical protein